MAKSRNSVFKSALYLINRFILQKKYLTGRSSRYNFKIRFKIEDGGGRYIYTRSNYEDEISDFLAENLNLKRGDVFMDVGANVGWYAFLINFAYPGTRIFAFEPDPVNFECLHYNLVKNNTPDISIVKKAVSDKNEHQKFYLYKNSNKGRNSMLPINDYGSIDVESIKLNDFLKEQQIASVRMMKMDIEGFEYIALKGASEILSDVELLLMEFSPKYMRKGDIDPADLIDLLKSHNFFAFTIIQDNKLSPLSYESLMDRHENINLFLLKSGQRLIDEQFIEN